MSKRSSREPTTSSPPEQLLEESPNDEEDSYDAPPAAKKSMTALTEFEPSVKKEIAEEEEEVEEEMEEDFFDEEEDRDLSNASRQRAISVAHVDAQHSLEDDEDASRMSMPAAIGDEEEEDDDSDSVFDKIELPPIDTTFYDICEGLKLLPEVITGSWEIYFHATQRVLLEGDPKAWQLAAVYYYFLSKYTKRRGKSSKRFISPLPVTLNTMLDAFDLSAIEFFDKLQRLIETIHSRKLRRFSDHVKKCQESLAVTAVVYKRYLKVFRKMFAFVPETGEPGTFSTHQVFTACWIAFLLLKRNLPNEDLINSLHLLFCVIGAIYTDICERENNIQHHLSLEFVDQLLTTDQTILRTLCRLFDGVVLDAKHFSEHVFPKLDHEELPTSWNFGESSAEILEQLNNAYTNYILFRGQFDERMFVPKAEDMKLIFDPKYNDDSSIIVLQRSSSNINFKDASFLAKVANKNCLDKLATSSDKNGQKGLSNQPRIPVIDDGKTDFRNTDDKSPYETANRLKNMVVDWELETSDLKSYCEQMSDNPIATLLLKRDILSEKFRQQVEEMLKKDPEFDKGFNADIKEHYQSLEKLFLISLEKMIGTELRRKYREDDLIGLLRKEEFLDAVFCFCLELVLFCNGSFREFPWSAEINDVHPFLFYKSIDFMINHLKEMSRPMVQHFNKIEERIIEEYAWEETSPLWGLISRCPLNSFNEFGEDWFEKGQSPLKFTPMKKRQVVTDEMGRQVQTPPALSRSVRLFLKRVYFTAALRLHDLCDRIGMGQRSKSQIWTLFDYVLRNETHQFTNRHIDQLLMCCVYVVAKINSMGTTFLEIMAHYKRQPQATSSVYREVPVDAEYLIGEEEDFSDARTSVDKNGKKIVYVDVIKYYNLIFRDRVKAVIHEIESATEADLMEMPLPTHYGLTPVKTHITRNISVQALPRTMHGSSRQEIVIANMIKNGMSYDCQNSPRKDLKLINERISNSI